MSIQTPAGAYGIEEVSKDHPDAITCGECGRAWAEDITPAGRCPWEDLHDYAAKAERREARNQKVRESIADRIADEYVDRYAADTYHGDELQMVRGVIADAALAAIDVYRGKR